MDLKDLIREIRLGLQPDGGDLELVEDQSPEKIKLRIKGKSKGAELVHVSLKKAVQDYVARVKPEIQSIEFV